MSPHDVVTWERSLRNVLSRLSHADQVSEPDTASVTPFRPVLLEAPIPDLATRAEPKLVELRGTPEATVA